ncbi:hypothetical protein HDU87_000369 [Geranomyces variabilis]|uniref:Uncharacterized protein n=1 Tax=Geranomyces variabilis TaxID=109894 RepID=A0AAD5XUB9_9FUNG|nr:hypothetical protein HDU87_000369 [Geranomyces variabilis]
MVESFHGAPSFSQPQRHVRPLTRHIHDAAGLPLKINPIIINKDNAGVVAQIASGFIKSNHTKHIAPKVFATYERDGIDDKVTKIASAEDVADI